MDKRFWSSRARQLVPYTPGEQPKIQDLIKLNTNECPYPPSPHVIEAIQRAANAGVRLYPDPESSELREAIASRHLVKANQVFVGNGSDEVLALAFAALFDNQVKFADITYSFYTVFAEYNGLSPVIVPLNVDFTLPVDGFFGDTGCVIANPNAPTGICIDINAIRAIAANTSAVVIIDEAYVEFGGRSALELLGEFPNLVIVKTFSKSHALAGLRVGYAIASEDIIEALNTVKNSFNSYPVDRIAQTAGKAAMEDESYYQKVIEKIAATREWTRDKLQSIGFEVLPSSANFLFARLPGVKGDFLLKELRDRAILVRRFETPRIKDFLRITIGTDGEMERLVYCLKQLI